MCVGVAVSVFGSSSGCDTLLDIYFLEKIYIKNL